VSFESLGVVAVVLLCEVGLVVGGDLLGCYWTLDVTGLCILQICRGEVLLTLG